MSIVEDARRPAADRPPPKDAKFVGWLLAVAITFGQLALLVTVSSGLDERLTAQALAHGTPLWWNEPGGWIVGAVIATIVAPVIIIPGPFGFRHRQLLPPMPRWRWHVVAAVLAACALADGALLGFGQSGGYALPDEAVFTSGGREVARHRWAEAAHVSVACHMLGKQKDSPSLLYDVRFADGRLAHLGRAAAFRRLPQGSLKPWLEAIGPIDAALRPRPGVLAVGTAEPVCAAVYATRGDGRVLQMLGMIR